MDQWKLHIQSGNRHFLKKRYLEAEQDYNKAILRVRKIFPAWFNRQQAVAALVVSYHNQADVFNAQKLFSKSEDMLREGYEFLQHTAAKQPVDDALMSGLRCSYTQLLKHIKSHGSRNNYVPQPFDFSMSSTSHPEIEVTQNVPTR